MTTLNYLLLAAENPRRSGELYRRLLGTEPAANSETFVLFVLPNGIKIGLWQKTDIRPTPLPAGGIEVSFSEPDNATVDKTYAAWKAAGVTVLQKPENMDFGYTFTVADPDGNRLRVFALNDNPR